MRFAFILILSVFGGAAITGCADAKPKSCARATFDGLPFSVCEVSSSSDIRLFLKDRSGQVYGSFDALNASLTSSQQQLVFAVNGGMYHKNRNPVGLYIENGIQASKLNTNEGPGNFHLLPNGVFWIGEGRSGVTAAKDFDEAGVQSATQSGPMLVIENKLHPAFKEKSTSLRIRNGVGQTADGRVIFVKSETAVNFHTLARFFRDELNTPNALFLDGTVSKLYSKDLGRNDKGQDMGPIIGVIEAVP